MLILSSSLVYIASNRTCIDIIITWKLEIRDQMSLANIKDSIIDLLYNFFPQNEDSTLGWKPEDVCYHKRGIIIYPFKALIILVK